MYARAEDTKVRIGQHWGDPDEYVTAFEELTEAVDSFNAHRTDLATADLQPFRDRLSAAEDDVDDLFSETLTIEEAEKIHSALFKAIIRAKANDGRFNTGDTGGGDVIPFPIQRTRSPLTPMPPRAA